VARPRLVSELEGASKRPEASELIVIGAGLLGLATASALARRGREVTVLEQAVPGHRGAGSAGSCRIFRLGYPDPRYVAAARRARRLWDELAERGGRQILFGTPQLTIGAELEQVAAAMRAAGAPTEVLPEAEVAARFPGLAAGGPALLETESCVTSAAAALAALAAECPDIRSGVRASGLADDGRRVTVHTDQGPLTARTVVVCAGPWTSELLTGAGARIPSAPTLEQAAYLLPAGADVGDGRADVAGDGPVTAPRSDLPIFICHGQQAPYGLPVPDSGQYKIGIHPAGPPVSPDAQSQEPDPVLSGRLAEVARRYLPGLDPAPAKVERCIYDNTPDEDFVLDRVGNVVIGCGTSGHGFKFGPLIGEWLAALTDGAPPEGPAGETGADALVSEFFALAQLGRFGPVSR
jgi:sarcosine oxidase